MAKRAKISVVSGGRSDDVGEPDRRESGGHREGPEPEDRRSDAGRPGEPIINVRASSAVLVTALVAAIALSIVGWYQSSVSMGALERRIADVQRENEFLEETVRFVGKAYRTYDFKYAQSYVQPGDPEIVALAKRLGTPEAAYEFVRDDVKYSPYATSHVAANIVLQDRRGDCLGQSNLLASLLRAMGVPPDRVEVVFGSIWLDKLYVNHGWVEYEVDDKVWGLDSTIYLGRFGFRQWPRQDFYRRYKARARFVYDDTHSEIIYQAPEAQ